jgi:hypothetical protein
MDAVVKCREEEFAPFFAWPTRRRNGWRWLPFYLRGPAWPGPFGFLFTLLGIWRFARRPRRLVDVPGGEWLHSRIVNTCPCLGSYGMGGPGFLGLECRQHGKTFWIVFTLWTADSWLTLDGKLLESGLIGDEKKTHVERGIVSIEAIHGGSVDAVTFSPASLVIEIGKEDGVHTLELRRDGSTVPPWRRTGGRKAFRDEESLEDALVVSRRANLWTAD